MGNERIKSLVVSEIGNIERCLHFGRHDTILLAPLIYPIVHCLVPKLRVLRFEHPMAFVREIQHLGRHLKPLQRGEELKAFADIESVIVLAVKDERGRVEFVGE